MKNSFFLLLALTLTSPAVAFGSGVRAESRSYTYSCGYFSSAYADVQIHYRNHALSWGVKVELIGGVEGYRVQNVAGDSMQRRFDWEHERSMVMPAVAPYEWSSTFAIQTAQRSSNLFIDGFDFVFKITHPDGRIEYDNGLNVNGTNSFYRLTFSRNRSRCMTQDGERPVFTENLVEVVRSI